jgi:hypothetical protein
LIQESRVSFAGRITNQGLMRLFVVFLPAGYFPMLTKLKVLCTLRGRFMLYAARFASTRISEHARSVDLEHARFTIRKVLAVGNPSRFVDLTIMVIQSGLTILAQPREATHSAQRIEVATVAFGLNGISLEMAHPLFRRSLGTVRRGPAWETGRAGVADPVAKSVRSGVS